MFILVTNFLLLLFSIQWCLSQSDLCVCVWDAWCFHNPLNPDMDYRIFNMHYTVHIYIYIYIYMCVCVCVCVCVCDLFACINTWGNLGLQSHPETINCSVAVLLLPLQQLQVCVPAYMPASMHVSVVSVIVKHIGLRDHLVWYQW